MEGDPRNPRVSLLKKYDIPVDNLSYEYIEKSSDKKELERIVRILRSGEEGSYPDLLKFAENRLRLFAPESKVLRIETPVLTKECLTHEEWSVVENELLSWEKDMSIMDKSLNFEKGRIKTVSSKNLPDVRKVVQPKIKKEKTEKVKNYKNTRIKSGDYAAWDKFDVDKELLKIDVEEERKQEEYEKKQREAKKLQKEKKIEILDADKENFSSMEQQVLANQAKDCGNECYKSGDLENALRYYEISIQLHPTVNAYNNRALTYLKLKQFDSAIGDCNKVLQIEKNNIKALHRRATAYQNLVNDKEGKNYDRLALKDLDEIIYLEPNNKIAQADFQKLKKKLNIEDSGKKFRMPISEDSDKDENSKQVERKKETMNTIDSNTPLEKLPLTYYGPSTSTFQCEPYSMLHRALSGTSVSGQILCKCYSNTSRQNPLCQKCGEAMSTPKPAKAVKSSDDYKSVMRDNEVETQFVKKQISEFKVETSSFDYSNATVNEITNENLMEPNLESNVTEKGYSIYEIDSVEFENNIDSDKNKSNSDILNDVQALEVNISSTVEVTKENFKKTLVSDKAIFNSDKDNRELINKEITEKETEAAERKSSNDNVWKKSIIKNNNNNNNNNINSLVPESSSSQESNIHSSRKSITNKKQSKDHKKDKVTRKYLELTKIEPLEVVHAAKYLHPTSVEPKIKSQITSKSQQEANVSSNTFYKAFLPSSKCCSSECSRIGLAATSRSSTTKKILKEEANSDLSFEGNKENISESQCNSNMESRGNEEMKREVIDSAFEFMKTWEELKKFDESYAKRAEIIRKIRPSDLSKVIGIKLDSDMLSCLLECLMRHFVESDPKRVVELLRQLPQVPRYGLVSMFLEDADKKKMKKLIDTAEVKGFRLDEDAKKNLTILS